MNGSGLKNPTSFAFTIPRITGIGESCIPNEATVPMMLITSGNVSEGSIDNTGKKLGDSLDTARIFSERYIDYQ
jgi:hypothetical protein